MKIEPGVCSFTVAGGDAGAWEWGQTFATKEEAIDSVRHKAGAWTVVEVRVVWTNAEIEHSRRRTKRPLAQGER
jgi:hypothetical protein